jgi:hypothetical protein
MSRETRTPTTPHPPLYFTRRNHRRCCTHSMMDVSHLFPMELPRVATESSPSAGAVKPRHENCELDCTIRGFVCVRACGFDSRRRRLHLGEILNLKTLRTTSVSGSTSSYEREGGCTPRAGDVAPPRGCRRTIDLICITRMTESIGTLGGDRGRPASCVVAP